MAPDLTGGTGGAEILIEENALIATLNTTSEASGEEKITRAGADEISIYIVREGDTISQIAEMYGVKISTIKGFNDIKNDSDLKVGQDLLILPIDGTSHTVAKGETLGSIAQKYNSDETDIKVFNDLSSSALVVGSEIIIPNAEPAPAIEVKSTKVATVGTKTADKKTSTTNTPYSSGFYTHPIPRGSVKSQGFHGPYEAQDLAAPIGTKIVASSGGRVIAAKLGYNGGYGNMVIIDDGVANVLYAHMSELSVSTGEVLDQGEQVGLVGSTGRSTGPHLHIEYRGKKGPMKTPVWK